MPYTALGKNLMLNAMKGTNPTAPVTHAGLLDAATPITGVTGSNTTDVFSKTAHGLSNGDLVVLTEKTGGSGITAGDANNANGLAEPLFVITANANDFQLSRTPGGSAVDLGSDITAVTVIELLEISGGSPAYARVAIAFNNAVDGSMDDSTNGAVFNVPAGATVDYVGFYSASSAGNLNAIDRVTSEAFAGQGTYTVTDADLAIV